MPPWSVTAVLDVSPATPLRLDAAYRAHRQSVYRWALRFGAGQHAWAEDLTHDVFLQLHRHLGQLTDVDELGAWLYRVTANLAVSRLKREASWLGRVERALSQAPPPRAPDEVLEGRDEAAAALATLGNLPDRERVALSMRVLDGRSQREIAATLGLSEGYVSKLLARAWERVRADGWEVDDAP